MVFEDFFFLHPSSSLKNVTIIYWNLEFYSTTFFGDSGRTCGSFLSYLSRWVSFFKVPNLPQAAAFFKKGCCGKTCELWVLYGFLYSKKQHHLAWAKFWGKLADPKFDLEAEQNTRRQRHGIHHQRWRNHQALIRSVTQLHNISWWKKTGALKTWHGMVEHVFLGLATCTLTAEAWFLGALQFTGMGKHGFHHGFVY